jgi:hypothetical protein
LHGSLKRDSKFFDNRILTGIQNYKFAPEGRSYPCESAGLRRCSGRQVLIAAIQAINYLDSEREEHLFQGRGACTGEEA